MGLAHAQRLTLRSVALAAVFGAVGSFTVPTGFVQGAGEETHMNHYCDPPSECKDYTFTGPCGDGSLCKGNPVAGQFYTCTPGGTITCVNSKKTYGFTNCPGKCQNTNQTPCDFNIYHCK